MQERTLPRTLIVTGMSGAGKSRAIQILEDMDFFCVDNVPPKLVFTFIDLCRTANSEIDNLALVTDIRGDGQGDLMSESFQKALADFKANKEGVSILFLEADTPTLVTRYQTTRRKHPLTAKAGSLTQSIGLEREKLQPLRDAADEIIDTTDLSLSELQKKIRVFLKKEESNPIHLTVSSFGYKYGMPIGADFVFDVRFLPNPFYKKELRELTGNDAAVRAYVMSTPKAEETLDRIEAFIAFVLPQYHAVGKDHVQVAFGCTGGQHRSVTCANLLADRLADKGFDIDTEHRDIDRNRQGN